MQSLHVLCFIAYALSVLQRNIPVNVGAAVCDPNRVMECANLGNIRPPFWGDTSCAASESLVISNCSGEQASWESFAKLATGGSQQGAPQLTGLDQAGSYTYINLTWKLDDVLKLADACSMPFPASSVDQLLPRFIDLTLFNNGTFQIDPSNYFLLFDCAGLKNFSIPNSVYEESPTCGAYKQQCNMTQFSCVQLNSGPIVQLALAETLIVLSCSHFTFLATSNSSTIDMISDGKVATIQLLYTDPDCKRCSESGGQCVSYYNVTLIFQGCSCGVNGVSDSNCYVLYDDGCKNVFSCHTRAIASGGSTMAVVAILVLLALRWWLLKSRVRNSTKLGGHHTPKELEIYPNNIDLQDLDKLIERPIEMSYSAISLATSSFINFVGEGGFGKVYMGTVSGMQIAVKVVKFTSEQTKRHFINEVATIGRIHHVHVVRLLGFCTEEHHRILVYDYMNNGSLDRWLFSKQSEGDSKQLLCWQQRYDIAVGVAKGLGYLHEECRHRIVHCDIKPQNILLDEDLCPKIADFGLAKLMGRDESRVSTMARGTPGYMAPEFWMGVESHVTTKFDVYSYGMLLLELISAHPNFENDVCFPEEAFEAAMEGNIASITDQRLGISSYMQLAEDQSRKKLDPNSNMLNSVRKSLFVALWCIEDNPKSRPHMSEVVQYLEGSLSINEEPPRPTISSISLSLHRPQSAYESYNQHNQGITLISGR